MHSFFLSGLQPGQQRLTGSMVRGRETVSAQRALAWARALPAAAVLKASRHETRLAMKPGSRGGRGRGAAGASAGTLGSG
jgi:hypothetical protein